MPVDAVRNIDKITFDKIKDTYQNSQDKSIFAEMVNNAIKNIDSGINLTDQGVEKILSGSDTDITQILVDMQKTEMTLDLTLQIREKIVDAYKEIMRMQI